MDNRRLSETSTRSGSARTRGFTVTDGASRQRPSAIHLRGSVNTPGCLRPPSAVGKPGVARHISRRTRLPGKGRSGFHIQASIAHALLLLVSAVALVATAKPFGEPTAAEGLTGHPAREISHENAWNYRYPGGYENARTYRF